uniref:USP domain-containing protein n=1 Tax=Solanum lycopersicum TaxID=4081 RepID=K4CS32_SOLLC
MESFTKIKKIKFSCERCKTLGPFEKQLLICHSPNVVVLHSKRFKYNGLVIQKVELHSGLSVSSRHYYNFIRCAPNEWYKFDDEKIKHTFYFIRRGVLHCFQTISKATYPSYVWLTLQLPMVLMSQL